MTWLWPALAVVLPLFLFCTCLLYEPLWRVFGMSSMKPIYADWMAVLAACDAKAAGVDPYAWPSAFDPYFRPHVYGPWWMELRHLGITRADRAWMGTVLLITSIAMMVWVCRPRGPLGLLGTVLLVASPPMLLAFERGNNDLVIFLLLASAGLFLAKSAWWRSGMAAGLIFFAAALKLYPLAAAPILLTRGRRARAWAWLLAVVLAFVVVRVWYNADFARIHGIMPRPSSATAYGIRVISFVWNTQGMKQLWFGLGLVVGLGCWAWVGWRAWKERLDLAYLDCLWVSGGAAWVLCYFANTNYAYRAVLLVLPAAVWLRQSLASSGRARVPAGVAFAAVVFLCWIRIGHTMMEAITTNQGLLMGATALGLENGLALGVSLYLTGAGAVWVVTRWRAGNAPGCERESSAG